MKASLAESESEDDEADPDEETGDEEDEEGASGEDNDEGKLMRFLMLFDGCTAFEPATSEFPVETF